MFERFTKESIKAIELSEKEARSLGHNYVGAEQILLGLIGEGTGIAAKVLKSLGVNLKDTWIEVEKIIGRGSGFVAVEIPFTPRAKRVLELSLEQARRLGHNYIGTEHLLIGITKESREGDGGGAASLVFKNLGIELTYVMTQVLTRLDNETVDSDKAIKSINPPIVKFNKNQKEPSDKEIDNREDNDLVSQLEKLASLKREGLLTNKEFVEAKRKLIF